MVCNYNMGGQPFQSEGQMRLSGAARGPECQTKTVNTKMRMYIILLQYFYCKAVRRLVLLAMKKYFNVRLDGWARQQNNVIEMAVREQGGKAKLRVGAYFILDKSCSQE